MKVVLDTNVLVSALLKPNGSPASILNLIVNLRIQLLYDNRILREYIEVLNREKFGFNAASVDALTGFFVMEGEFITADHVSIKFKDDDDRIFYEAMLSGGADFLITGNLGHFPKDPRIKSPVDFLRMYDESKQPQ